MTEATLEAQTLLWEWASEACEEDDPEQRAWKVLYAECLVDACEHARLLPAHEVVQWRRLAAHVPERLAQRRGLRRASRQGRRAIAFACQEHSKRPGSECCNARGPIATARSE